MSADLSSEALGEGGGHPSLKNVIDLEGCSPISANLFCKISALAIRVSGLVR